MRAIILSAGQGTRLLPKTAHTPKCLLPLRGHESVLEHQLRALAACGVHEARIVVGFKAEQVEASLRERPVPGIRTQTLENPLFAVADNLVSAWLAARELSGDYVLLNGDTLFEREALAACLSEPEGLGSYYLAAVDRLARKGVVESVALDGEWWQEIDTASDWVEARAALAPRGRLDAIPPDRVRPRVGKRRRRAAALALACAGLLCVDGKPAFADEPVAEPKPKLEARGDSDDWLHGPSLKLSPTEGWLRPYVVGAGGVRSDVHRLGIEDPTNRFQGEPYAGRVGGGLELRLDERSSLALEGSTILEPGPVAAEATEAFGLKLRLRF